MIGFRHGVDVPHHVESGLLGEVSPFDQHG
jgi:hypothetical protein